MAIRREIIIIFVLLISIAVAVKLLEILSANFGGTADASKFVLEDLHSKYPGADVAIMSIVPKTSAGGSHYVEVKTRVTQDALTPCPKRSHIFYNYPVQNFVPQTPEIITNACQVCTEAICNIAFPEEAIIASHTLQGTDAVGSFISAYPDAYPTADEGADSWLVKWDSPSAQYYYQVELHRNGTILNVKRMVKTS